MIMGKAAWTKAPSCLKNKPPVREFSRAIPRQPHDGRQPTPAANATGGGTSLTFTSAYASISEARKQQKILDRDVLVSVLETKVTKRDAKSYMNRFVPVLERKGAISFKQRAAQSRSNGANASATSQVSAQGTTESAGRKPEELKAQLPFYVALVKFRAPQAVDDATLDGVGKTLSQLRKLGLICVVVVDGGDAETNDAAQRNAVVMQAERIATAVDAYGPSGARVIDSPITLGETSKAPVSPFTSQSLFVGNPNFLIASLEEDEIPVIPSIAYTANTSSRKLVDADEVILALIRQLSGLQFLDHEVPEESRVMKLLKAAEVYRLIILDPLGGTPAINRATGRHIFLNLEQEFEEVKNDLSKVPAGVAEDADLMRTNAQHLKNAELAKNALALLPPTSSAIITTPQEAAKERGPEEDWALVGTRRGQNPLIHNLLTDKPVQSSSLPTERFKTVKSLTGAPQIGSLTTLAKRGMPLTMFPDPRLTPWRPPQPGQSGLSLTDPRIDLARLVHLIEDSFGRKLDVDHYLKRIQGNLAGVIIAGEYEGGAILTWEKPLGLKGSDAYSPDRLVPYLDKFAVLRKSQGAGGVADIVFNAMVRTCFPSGVCWRSRKDNPVNKWYFERSRGTVKFSDMNWTMFWTTPKLDKQRYLDYESVCRGVEPSWADKKQQLD